MFTREINEFEEEIDTRVSRSMPNLQERVKAKLFIPLPHLDSKTELDMLDGFLWDIRAAEFEGPEEYERAQLHLRLFCTAR